MEEESEILNGEQPTQDEVEAPILKKIFYCFRSFVLSGC